LGIFLLIIFLSLTFFWAFCGFIIKKKSYKVLQNTGELGISIIIAAKNEIENLQKNLKTWLNLEYDNYELIIVVNNSSDESYGWLLNQVHTKLKVINIPRTPEGISAKKFALTEGVKASQYPYIVFTDADCIPVSPQWLNYFNQSFQNQNDIVFGISPYKQYSTLLNGFIQWETFFTAVLYVTAALINKPYMAVGRNWGMRKEIFFKEKGFEKHLNIPSGDDDLFIQNLQNTYPIDVLLYKNSQTVSEPQKSWSTYLHQKTRHLSSSKFYPFKTKFKLFILNFIIFSSYFYIIQINIIFKNKILFLTLCLMYLTKFISIYTIRKIIGMQIPILYYFVGDIVLLMFQVMILPISYLKKITWK